MSVDRIFIIALAILIGLSVGLVLGNHFAPDSKPGWESFLTDQWIEVCPEAQSTCSQGHIRLNADRSFLIENLPSRYGIGSEVKGIWTLMMVDQDKAFLELIGEPRREGWQVRVLYMMSKRIDAERMEFSWVDMMAKEKGVPDELSDDTFVLMRSR